MPVTPQAILRGLLTPGGLFGADRTVVVATHHLPDEICCPHLQIDVCRVPWLPIVHTGLTGVPSHD